MATVHSNFTPLQELPRPKRVITRSRPSEMEKVIAMASDFITLHDEPQEPKIDQSGFLIGNERL